MRKNLIILLTFILTVGLVLVFRLGFDDSNKLISGAPPYGATEDSIPDLDPYPWFYNWKRPSVPPKVALQVGHWKNDELPDELEKLRGNGGSTGGGFAEWEVNLAIAKETAKILQSQGITVDILPATIPPKYWADVFIAIHADGSEDPLKRGFKIASPWRDFTGNADLLVEQLYDLYSKTTNFTTDDEITKNMRGYYAFSWWRFEHAVHPMTTAAIVETGFLTNYSDRKLLINSPEIPAAGIANGVIKYLENIELLN